MERCCFRAVGASVSTTARLSSSLMALVWPNSASYLSRSASHSRNAAEKSASLVGNFWLSKGRLQTKLLEWLSGASSRQSNRKNSQPFCSLIPLVIFVATISSCVHEFSIANSCLPRDLQSCVISAGSTNVVFFRAVSSSSGNSSLSNARYVSTWKLKRSHWSRSFKERGCLTDFSTSMWLTGLPAAELPALCWGCWPWPAPVRDACNNVVTPLGCCSRASFSCCSCAFTCIWLCWAVVHACTLSNFNSNALWGWYGPQKWWYGEGCGTLGTMVRYGGYGTVGSVGTVRWVRWVRYGGYGGYGTVGTLVPTVPSAPYPPYPPYPHPLYRTHRTKRPHKRTKTPYPPYRTHRKCHTYLPVLNHQKTCFSFLLKLDHLHLTR